MIVEFPIPRQRASLDDAPSAGESPPEPDRESAGRFRGVLRAVRSGLVRLLVALVGPTDPLLARMSYEPYYFDMVSISEERPI